MLLLLHRGGRAWVTVTHTQYDGKIYTTLGFCPVFLSFSSSLSSLLLSPGSRLIEAEHRHICRGPRLVRLRRRGCLPTARAADAAVAGEEGARGRCAAGGTGGGWDPGGLLRAGQLDDGGGLQEEAVARAA